MVQEGSRAGRACMCRASLLDLNLTGSGRQLPFSVGVPGEEGFNGGKPGGDGIVFYFESFGDFSKAATWPKRAAFSKDKAFTSPSRLDPDGGHGVSLPQI